MLIKFRLHIYLIKYLIENKIFLSWTTMTQRHIQQIKPIIIGMKLMQLSFRNSKLTIKQNSRNNLNQANFSLDAKNWFNFYRLL